MERAITRAITQAGAGGGGSPSLPVNTLAPAITGQPYIGETLTATPGTWTGADSVIGQWYVNGVATGDTDTSYTILLADAGKSVEYRETATNTAGSVTQDSNAITAATLHNNVVHLFAASAGGMWDATQRQYVEGGGIGGAFAPGSGANSRLYQIMDAKEPLTPSAELTPVTFASATGWTTSHASVVIGGGVCTWNNSGTGHNVSCVGASSPIGAMFLVEVVVDSISSGGLTFAAGGAAQTKVLAVGVNTFYINNRGSSLPDPSVYAVGTTNAVISKFSVKRVSTATSFLAKQTTSQQPLWKDTPSHFADFDAVDDALVAVLPAMGSNCTVASVGPGGSPSILTGQTIGAGNYTVAADFARYLVINRALTGPEAAALTAWLTEGASA